MGERAESAEMRNEIGSGKARLAGRNIAYPRANPGLLRALRSSPAARASGPRRWEP